MTKEEKTSLIAQEFAHANPKLFVIVADPETDCLFAAYKDSITYGRIKSLNGRKQRIVKEMLYHSKFYGEITGFEGFKFVADMFLSQLAELLQLKFQKAPEFFKWVFDAAWYLPQGKRNPQPEALTAPTHDRK